MRCCGRPDRGGAGGAPSTPVVMTRNESAVSAAGNVLLIAKDEQAVRDELSWREGRLLQDSFGLDVRADCDRIVVTAD